MTSARSKIRLAALLVTSLLVLLLILDVTFQLVVPFLPLRFHGYMPMAAQVVAQYSKTGARPHDYIAVVGDSYAQGGGDWLYAEAKRWGRPPYATHHLLHQRLGRDVVSLGINGASSISGMALIPDHLLQRIHAEYLFGQFEDPAAIVVLFYEGNDLEDNLRHLRKVYADYDSLSTVEASSKFDDILTQLRSSDDRYRIKPQHTMWFTRSVRKMLRVTFGEHSPRPVFEATKKTNRVRIDGQMVTAPDFLQGPAMELSFEETQLAIALFGLALRRLRERFPEADVFVAYIPSPVACYQIVSADIVIRTYYDGKATTQPAELVWQRSDAIAHSMAEEVMREGARFIDTRAALRERAESAPIHGPLDWAHLNRAGFETLADAVGVVLEQRLVNDH